MTSAFAEQSSFVQRAIASQHLARHVRSLAALHAQDGEEARRCVQVIGDGLRQYVADTTDKTFPAPVNWFGIKDEEYAELLRLVG